MKIGLLKKREKRWEVTVVDNKGITPDNIVSNKSIPCTQWEIVTYKEESYKITNIVGDLYTIENPLTKISLDVQFEDLISKKRNVYESVYYLTLGEDNRYRIEGQIPSYETKIITMDLLTNKFKSNEARDAITNLLMYKCHIETGHPNFLPKNTQILTIYGNYISSTTP